MAIPSNMCSLLWILYFSIAYVNFGVASTDFAANELCPCRPQDICPQTIGMKPEDEFYLETILKCAEPNHVRCCGVSIEKNVGTATTLSSVSGNNAEPESTTIDSFNALKTIQESTEVSSDTQDEQTTELTDESIEIHPTELDALETTTISADDENTIAYEYGARNEDALRELDFDDVTTDGSIDECEPVAESTQLPVAQDENTESMTENDQEITTEISTDEKQQSTTVDSMTAEQPEKIEEPKLSVADRDPDVITETSGDTGKDRALPVYVHPVIRKHGMMMMEVHRLLSNFMKKGIFQTEISSETSQQIENVTQSEFETAKKPKYQRRTLRTRNSLQKTQSISTTISTPVNSIALESSPSTVRYYSKRQQYFQRRNPNGISNTSRTNSNENLVTVTESMPMTVDEKKQFLANKRKMLFAARRGPSVRNATITTTPNTLETDEPAEKVAQVTKVRATSRKRSKRPMRRYNPNTRVESSTEPEINATINEE